MIYQFCYYKPMKPETFLKLAKHPLGKNFVYTSNVDPNSTLKEIYHQIKPRSWVSIGRGVLVTRRHKENWWLHELLTAGKKGEKDKIKGFERFYKAALVLAEKYKGAGLYCVQVNRKHPRYRNQLSHFCKFEVTEEDIRKMERPVQRAKFFLKLYKNTYPHQIHNRRPKIEKGLHDVILEIFGGK